MCIAVDVKVYDEQSDFSQSPFCENFCVAYLVEDDYRKLIEEDSDPETGIKNIDCLSKEEIDEFIVEEMQDFVFLRYFGDNQPTSQEDINKLVSKYTFWPPRYIWLSGKLINNNVSLITDVSGDVIGVQF